jgi:hypothetical protein
MSCSRLGSDELGRCPREDMQCNGSHVSSLAVPFAPPEVRCTLQHSPGWEADSYSAGQETSHLLCSSKVRYRIHKSCPLDHILIHISPPFYALYLGAIFSSAPRFPKLSLEVFLRKCIPRPVMRSVCPTHVWQLLPRYEHVHSSRSECHFEHGTGRRPKSVSCHGTCSHNSILYKTASIFCFRCSNCSRFAE